MKRFQQILSCYLVLCLALAGAIGLSPDLHWLLEHGGKGVAHTHAGFSPQITPANHAHRHEDGHRHAHATERPFSRSTRVHTHEFDFPFIGLFKVLRQIIQHSAARSTEPSQKDHGHQHHSLPETLVNGLADHALEVPLLSFEAAEIITANPFTHFQFVFRDWDAQTAPRGPPRAWS